MGELCERGDIMYTYYYYIPGKTGIRIPDLTMEVFRGRAGLPKHPKRSPTTVLIISHHPHDEICSFLEPDELMRQSTQHEKMSSHPPPHRRGLGG